MAENAKNTEVGKFEDWAHLKITDRELSEQLDAMVSADMTDRSKFLRQLIRQEFLRRARGAHWVQVDPTLPYPVTIVNPVVEVPS